MCLFLAGPWVGLWSVIVAFLGHTHFGFFYHTCFIVNSADVKNAKIYAFDSGFNNLHSYLEGR